MSYEYEKENKEAVMINLPKANRELQEVYRKAKAFNKIANLIESNYVDYGDYTLEDIEVIVNGYWENE